MAQGRGEGLTYDNSDLYVIDKIWRVGCDEDLLSQKIYDCG